MSDTEDLRDSLPDDLNASEYVGPYQFPDNSRRRRPAYLYFGIAAVCLLLWLWRKLAVYGTSPTHWGLSVLINLAAMALCYAFLSSPNQCEAPALLVHNGLSNSRLYPLYLAVINLFAFGGYTNVTPQTCIGEAVVMLQAVLSFVLLGTGVTFLTRR